MKASWPVTDQPAGTARAGRAEGPSRHRSDDSIEAYFDIGELLRQITIVAPAFRSADAAWLWLADPVSRTCRPLASSVLESGFPFERLPYKGTILGWIADHREAVDVPDVFVDGRFQALDWWRCQGLTSYLGIPLVSRGEFLGVLALHGRAPFRIEPRDLALLESAAAQAAAALRTAKLLAESERARRTAEALARIGRDLTESLEVGVVAQRIADSLRSILGVRTSVVYRRDPDTGRLVAVTASGGETSQMGALEFPDGFGAVGLAARERRPVVTGDVLSDPRIRLTAEARDVLGRSGCRAVLAAPLVFQERVIGALGVGDVIDRVFEADDLDLMRAFADQATLALRNAEVLQESRARQDRLETLHSETERLLASISWILIAVDERDAVTRWNAAAELTFGIPAAAIVGAPLRDAPIHWDWPAMLDRIAETRDREAPTRFDDVAYRRTDGSEGHLGITLAPIRAEGGRRAGFLLLGSDATERRLLEAQLAQAQKLESIGQLAAGVAHELNTPIQFVGDNVRFLQGAFSDVCDLLGAYRALQAAAAGRVEAAVMEEVTRRETATDIDYVTAEIPTAISQTLEGISRMATIVRALKEFAHPDHGDKVAADLNQALLSTLTVARNEVKYVADVETELGELPLVVCQAGELNQVFLNLIVNAAHAIGDVVADTGRRGVIRVRTAREGDTVVIAISDTGGGIPEAVRARIFDPFFTTKPVGRGTGQGLSIARNVVVDKHGGTLTFATEIGRGSTFFVRLPLSGGPDPADTSS